MRQAASEHATTTPTRTLRVSKILQEVTQDN
jgi:hypothetical protein